MNTSSSELKQHTKIKYAKFKCHDMDGVVHS